MKEVKCPNCGTLFGKESNEVLTIKYRDLYRHFEGGRTWGPCRMCGTEVRWPQDDLRTAKEIR